MTHPLYLPLHRVTLSDEVEQAEAEMMRNTHTRPARLDEPETIITDFGGMHESRPTIVRRAFDGMSISEQAQQESFEFVLRWIVYPCITLFLVAAYFMGWLS